MQTSVSFYTYRHCKPDGTPFYVGKGKGRRAYDFTRRTTHHKNIVAKYGSENIKIIISNFDSEQLAFDDEIRLIAQLRKEGVLLCNISDGGCGASGCKRTQEQRGRTGVVHKGKIVSEETREKLRIASIGNTHNIGLKRSPETIEKLRALKIGIPRTDAEKEKLRAANLGKRMSESAKIQMSIAKKGRAGHPRSDESRIKQSNTTKGIKKSPEHIAAFVAAWIKRKESNAQRKAK